MILDTLWYGDFLAIRMKSKTAQLIVRPGQVAIFVHRGQIADVFEPGDSAEDGQPADPEHDCRLEVRIQQPVSVRSVLRQYKADYRPEMGHSKSHYDA